MVPQKKIVIDIDKEGNTSIDGKGFVGTECSHFLEEIESSLGQRTSVKNKPEYRQRRTIVTRNLQRGGR